MNRLNNKRALITGGTSAIGLETSRRFILEGTHVAITGSNPTTLVAAALCAVPLSSIRHALIIAICRAGRSRERR